MPQATRKRSTKKQLVRKRAAFVRCYLAHGNATQAAIEAGYSEGSASHMSHKLLRVSEIKDAIAKGEERLAKKTRVSAERVRLELAKIAFFNIKSVLEGHVGDKRPDVVQTGPNTWRLRSLEDIRDDDAAAISSVKHTTNKLGDTVVEVKFHDKVRALEILAKCLGMQRERVEHSGPDGKALPIVVYIPNNGRPESGSKPVKVATKRVGLPA